MDRPDSVAATLAECASHVPPGWRPLLARTLVKLLAVVEGGPARRAAVGQLQVCVGGAELWCVGVELLQLTGVPLALAERVPPVALLLGTGFDARDLVVYVCAVAVAVAVDIAVSRLLPRGTTRTGVGAPG